MMFIGEVYVNGKRIFQGQPFADREEAARYVFRNGPKVAKNCSTSHAYRDPAGNWRSNGNDIRWHKRWDYFRELQVPCDVGMFGDDAKQPSLI
jgi:hypothetical protein